MTILMTNILSIPLIAFIEEAGWIEWYKGLPEWQSFGLLVGLCVVLVIVIIWLAGDLIKESRLQQEVLANRKREERERERVAFFTEVRDRKKTELDLKKYRRELERFNDPYAKRYMPDLSDEEIHERIDFLEALDSETGTKRSTISLADRRIACRKDHDEERDKELRAISNTFLDDAQRVQDMMETTNYWNNKKRIALQKIGGAERNDNVTA